MTYPFERVVITGATGFIGRHLVEELVLSGCRPTILTRAFEGSDPFGSLGEKVRREQTDLSDREALLNVLLAERPATLFHLAGTRGRERASDASVLCAEINTLATVRLLDAAALAGARRVIILGSAAEYGPQPGPLHEGLPLRPTSPYGISKAAATRFAEVMHANGGVPVVILRPFTVYGPGQPLDMFVGEAVTRAIEGVPYRIRNERHCQDLVFVKDMVRALVAAACAPSIEGRVINIGSGRAYPLGEVAALIWQISQSRAPLLTSDATLPPQRDDDATADISLARNLLRWEPRVDMETGLKATIAWARQRSVGDGNEFILSSQGR